MSRILKSRFGDGIVVRKSPKHRAVLVIAPPYVWNGVSDFLNERGYVTGDSVSLFNGDRALTVTRKVTVPKKTPAPRNPSIARLLNKQMPGLFQVEPHGNSSVRVTATGTCSTASIEMAKYLLNKWGHVVRKSREPWALIVELANVTKDTN